MKLVFKMEHEYKKEDIKDFEPNMNKEEIKELIKNNFYYELFDSDLESYYKDYITFEEDKKINPNLRRFGILPKMRHLSGKIYPDFENTLKYLSDKELRDYNNFLSEIEYKINRLEKLQKRLF